MTRRRAKRPAASPLQSKPEWRQLRHPFKPQEIFSADRIADMHDMALRVLEELGIKVLLAEARTLYAKGGALVVGETPSRILKSNVIRSLPSASGRIVSRK